MASPEVLLVGFPNRLSVDCLLRIVDSSLEQGSQIWRLLQVDYLEMDNFRLAYVIRLSRAQSVRDGTLSRIYGDPVRLPRVVKNRRVLRIENEALRKFKSRRKRTISLAKELRRIQGSPVIQNKFKLRSHKRTKVYLAYGEIREMAKELSDLLCRILKQSEKLRRRLPDELDGLRFEKGRLELVANIINWRIRLELFVRQDIPKNYRIRKFLNEEELRKMLN